MKRNAADPGDVAAARSRAGKHRCTAQKGARCAGIAVLVGALVLCGQSAHAKVETLCEYSLAQTYSAALRYLRVDKGFEVVEKDPTAAYVLFRYVPPGSPPRPCDGSIELVQLNGRVRLQIRVPTMPTYHEQILRDELLKKMRDEYGDPLPAKPPTKKAPSTERDAGANRSQ
ncbi:MAG: hypothetical protein JW940_05660 [Polyangiaceae bacterium]|nr:hypothetical protein [Polyangiaceae bacterium]